MLHILYVEVNAIGVSLLLLILFKQRQNVGVSVSQRQFNNLIYATILMLVTDSVCWLLDGAAFANAVIYKTAAESLYYALNIIIPFLWVVYLETALSKERDLTLRRLRWLSIPMVLLLLFVIVNLFTGSIFTIDENNVYARNTGFYAFAAGSYAYLVYASIRAIAAARRASWKEDARRYYSLAFFIVLPAAGGVVQVFVYGVSLIWIFVAVAIMLMYLDTLSRQISTDPLTGINNRRELTKFVLRETRDPSRQGILALIMMDVDNFKQVNDTYGHYFGDEILVTVSKILKRSCQETPAFLARYGGDEFCIVYPADSVKDVEKVISGILRNVIRWNSMSDDMVKIGLSIGYSVWKYGQEDTMEDLFRRADQKMYEVKSEKKKY